MRLSCPACSATKFQRHERGEYVNGVFNKTEEIVLCVGCNRVSKLEELREVEIPQAVGGVF